MTQLSTHFTLEELIRSDKARELGNDNLPGPEHMENLRRLAAGLEAVRMICGNVPMTITSGYRNPVVNQAVGGVWNSAHALGLAADFHVAGLADHTAASKIRDSDLKFDQLILEEGRCVHISFDPAMRRQVLRQPGGPGSPCYEGLG